MSADDSSPVSPDACANYCTPRKWSHRPSGSKMPKMFVARVRGQQVRSDVQECERDRGELDSATSGCSLFTVVNDDRHLREHGDIAGLVGGPDEQLV